MPNKWTFQVPVIAEFVNRYIGTGIGWADPFSGHSALVEYRNDLNPKNGQPFCMEADAFLRKLQEDFITLDGVVFDPPYSMEQVKRSYENVGKKWDQDATGNRNGGFPRVRDEIAKIVRPGGKVLSFGWTTCGMGKNRGFEIEEILIVCHGGNHSDTLCVAENKL